jgi:hypothetical protein
MVVLVVGIVVEAAVNVDGIIYFSASKSTRANSGNALQETIDRFIN